MLGLHGSAITSALPGTRRCQTVLPTDGRGRGASHPWLCLSHFRARPPSDKSGLVWTKSIRETPSVDIRQLPSGQTDFSSPLVRNKRVRQWENFALAMIIAMSLAKPFWANSLALLDSGSSRPVASPCVRIWRKKFMVP